MTRNEIVKSEELLLDAMLNSKVDVLDKLIHPDLLFNTAMGQVVTKELDLDTYRKGLMKIHKIKAENQKINMIGDTAVVSVIIDLDGEFSGQPIGGKLLFLRVWKKFDTSWQVIAGSSVSI